MRPIDADSIKWESVEEEYGARTPAVVACQSLIQNAPTIDPVRHGEWALWIDTEEEMPIDGEEVLVSVYWKEYGDTILAYGHYSPRSDKWKLYSDSEGELIKGYDVIAWMPLPKPYREREGE